MSLPGYDDWLERGATEDDIWECGACGEECNGGDDCHVCGAERGAAVCASGTCGACERCDVAADADHDADR